MKKFLKWLGIAVLALVLVLVIAVLVLVNKTNGMAKKTYDVNLPKFAAANDSAALVRGAVIANSLCGGCHGGDFAGTEFFKDEATGSIPAPNITSGGRTKNYTDADWLRIIRYGVKPDKHGAMIMPSKEMGSMSNEDIAALVGYLKTIPASNKTWPDPEFTLFSKVLAGAGLFGDLYHAEIIDLQDTTTKTAPEPGPSVAYGAYTVGFHGCKSCHGDNLNGKKTPDPISPPGSNITKGGNFGKWSLEQFKNTLRTGTTPEGKALDVKFMPWAPMGLMTDMELEAIYNYLQSMPALPDDETVVKWNEKHQ